VVALAGSVDDLASLERFEGSALETAAAATATTAAAATATTTGAAGTGTGAAGLNSNGGSASAAAMAMASASATTPVMVPEASSAAAAAAMRLMDSGDSFAIPHNGTVRDPTPTPGGGGLVGRLVGRCDRRDDGDGVTSPLTGTAGSAIYARDPSIAMRDPSSAMRDPLYGGSSPFPSHISFSASPVAPRASGGSGSGSADNLDSMANNGPHSSDASRAPATATTSDRCGLSHC